MWMFRKWLTIFKDSDTSDMTSSLIIIDLKIDTWQFIEVWLKNREEYKWYIIPKWNPLDSYLLKFTKENRNTLRWNGMWLTGAQETRD